MTKIKNVVARFRLLLAVVTASLFGLALVGGQASAAPPTLPADPTGGAMGDVQTSVQTWVLTYGAPVLFGLVALGILISVGRRWAKRAGSSV